MSLDDQYYAQLKQEKIMSEIEPPYTPVDRIRNCVGEGSTHWMGCDCHESRWLERLNKANARIKELEDENEKLKSKGYGTPSEILKEQIELKSQLDGAVGMLKGFLLVLPSPTFDKTKNLLKEFLSNINKDKK